MPPSHKEYFPANLGVKDPRTNWTPQFINFPIPQRDLDLLGQNYLRTLDTNLSQSLFLKMSKLKNLLIF